jgi:hypothetical protein
MCKAVEEKKKGEGRQSGEAIKGAFCIFKLRGWG